MFSHVGKEYILCNSAKPCRYLAAFIISADGSDRLIAGFLCQFFCALFSCFQLRQIDRKLFICVSQLFIIARNMMLTMYNRWAWVR